jgi:HAMP domain-containing protein
MRLSVTARIALLAIGLALVSNLVLVAFVWQQVHDHAIDALRRDTIEQSDALLAVYRSGGMSALTRTIDEARAPGDRSLVIAIVDNGGKRLAGDGPDDITVSGSPAPTNFSMGMMGADPPWSEREAGYSVRPIGPDWLVSGRLLDDWEQEQRGIERAMLAATLLSLALGIGGGLVVTRYVGRRLNSVADAIEGVASGDLSRRVVGAPGGGDAFDRLATRLNGMLDKVERLMIELRVVTDSLAHDLRSPLARLRTKTETAVLLTDPAQRDAALGGLLVETDLVMRMLTMLIEISRAESFSRDRFATVDPHRGNCRTVRARRRGGGIDLHHGDRPAPAARHAPSRTDDAGDYQPDRQRLAARRRGRRGDAAAFERPWRRALPGRGSRPRHRRW